MRAQLMCNWDFSLEKAGVWVLILWCVPPPIKNFKAIVSNGRGLGVFLWPTVGVDRYRIGLAKSKATGR